MNQAGAEAAIWGILLHKTVGCCNPEQSGLSYYFEKQVKLTISASRLSEEARQLGNMGKVLCFKQAFPGWLSRWQDKKLMKNENVLQNFLAEGKNRQKKAFSQSDWRPR